MIVLIKQVKTNRVKKLFFLHGLFLLLGLSLIS